MEDSRLVTTVESVDKLNEDRLYKVISILEDSLFNDSSEEITTFAEIHHDEDVAFLPNFIDECAVEGDNVGMGRELDMRRDFAFLQLG